MGKRVRLSRWLEKGLARFHTIVSDTILVVDCAATEVLIKNRRLCTRWQVLMYLLPTRLVGAPSSLFLWAAGKSIFISTSANEEDVWWAHCACDARYAKKWGNQFADTAIGRYEVETMSGLRQHNFAACTTSITGDSYLAMVHQRINDQWLLGKISWSSFRLDSRIANLIFSRIEVLQYGRLEVLNMVWSFM